MPVHDRTVLLIVDHGARCKPQHFAADLHLLRDPALNKGTAFTEAERDALGLRGLLPPRVTTQEEQLQRVMANMRRQHDDLARYMYLAALLNRNEALFFRVVMEHPDEVMPITSAPRLE